MSQAASFLKAITLMFAVVIAAVAPAYAQRAPADRSFAIENVTVIDIAGGSRSSNQTVIIEGARIMAVGPSASLRPAAGMHIVDGRERFLIPGVWDMHAHPYHNLPARSLPVAVARGVTGIREMGGSIQHMAEATALFDEGLLAPRMLVAGPLLGNYPRTDMFPEGTGLSLLTPAEAREVVNRLVTQRVDFLKIHNGLSREVYMAIVDEARRWGLPFEGHLPVGMNILEVSDAGQRTVEHMGALAPMCVEDPAALTGDSGNPVVIDRAACAAVLAQLVRNGTWFSPTIGAPGQGNPAMRAVNLELVRMAHDAGVKLLPGSDWPGAGYWRGDYSWFERSAWADLAGMVEAGLTPLQVLRIGIVNPAVLMGMEHQLGRVAPGYLADLVLLEADPLLDIGNATRIVAVVANGRLVDQAERQRIFAAELEAQQRSSAQ